MIFSLFSVMHFPAAVSANPSIEQRAIAEEFAVSLFSAGCIPHGTLCKYERFYVPFQPFLKHLQSPKYFMDIIVATRARPRTSGDT